MKFLTLILCLLFSTFSFSQNDSNKIFKSTALKKGFYKSYQEYINNAPSLVNEFTVQIRNRRKTDSAVVCVDYTLVNEDEKTGSIWGFCDGKYVYIKRSTGLNNNKYWRLENIGVYPMYYYFEKSAGFGPGLMRVATLAASVLSDVDLVLAVKDENDKTHNVNERNVRKLLLDYPELVKQFEQDIEAYRNDKDDNSGVKKVDICKKYVLKLEKMKHK